MGGVYAAMDFLCRCLQGPLHPQLDLQICNGASLLAAAGMGVGCCPDIAVRGFLLLLLARYQGGLQVSTSGLKPVRVSVCLSLSLSLSLSLGVCASVSLSVCVSVCVFPCLSLGVYAVRALFLLDVYGGLCLSMPVSVLCLSSVSVPVCFLLWVFVCLLSVCSSLSLSLSLSVSLYLRIIPKVAKKKTK